MSARAALLAVCGLLVGALAATSAEADPGDQAFAAWAASRAIPLPSPGVRFDGRSARAIDDFVGAAQVVALGEPAHGAHEPLMLRNALVAYLVEQRGFTGVALETGISQSQIVARFVQCGHGNAREAAAAGLSWGFGAFAENVALLEWLRAWNCSHPRRLVRFYGIDVQGGDAVGGMTLAGDAIDGVADWLAARGAIGDAKELRAFKPDFTPERYRKLTKERRARISALLMEASRRVELDSPDSEARLWAVRNVRALEQLQRMFAAWPPVIAGQSLPPGFADVTALRDRAMADNLMAALRDEGAAGRIVLFAHNGHVGNGPLGQPEGTRSAIEPLAMGHHLRAILGTKFRTIGVLAGGAREGLPQRTEPPGSLERALAGLSPPFFLGLRQSPSWARKTQTINSNYVGKASIVPNRAFDAIVLLGPLTKGLPAEKD